MGSGTGAVTTMSSKANVPSLLPPLKVAVSCSEVPLENRLFNVKSVTVQPVPDNVVGLIEPVPPLTAQVIPVGELEEFPRL
jgi:hypothetical protein